MTLDKKKFILLSSIILVFILFSTNSEARKKKPNNYKMKYVGATKCNGSCHDAYYQAWKNTGHAKAFDLLKPGARPDAKAKAGLDVEKDYMSDPNCLRCHTTGYRQRGGFRPSTSKRPTGIDPQEPNKEQVGCEMCHTVAGGSEIRKIMKNTKGDFEKKDTEMYGQRWDYANVCSRCHLHSKNPHTPEVDKKYEFNFQERVKKVHNVKGFWTEDNMDQKLEKVKDRKKQISKSETTPLLIEDWKVKQKKKGPKLYLKKSTRPYNKVWRKDRKPFKKKYGKKYKGSKEWKEFLKDREWFKYQK